MGLELLGLPEDCISLILSLTSPKDACRSSLVSLSFQSAADSDMVWQKFLPSDYREILIRAASPVAFSSLKDLYLELCIPFLIDGGRMSFWLDRSSGKKCYRLSARELSITWANNPLYWSWKSGPQSRFSEVVELRTIWWLEIHGKIKSSLLSPNTTYMAYLIFKIEDRAYGLDTLPSEVSVEIGEHRSSGTAYLHCHYKKSHEQLCDSFCTFKCKLTGANKVASYPRNDGWIELELGEFFSDGGCEVKMSLMEVKGVHLKGGLVIEGMEVRPKEY